MADPYNNDVVLLIRGNGSTTVTNEVSPATVISNTGVYPVSSPAKFGSALNFNNSPFLQVPTDAAFAFGTGDFTVEFWINTSITGSNDPIIDFRASTTDGFLITSESGSLKVYTGNTARITSTYTKSAWVHIAATRASGTLRLFIDGIKVATEYADTNNYVAPAATGLRIGCYVDNSTLKFEGYLDEIRVTKGVARYTADFSVPTTAFEYATPATQLITKTNYGVVVGPAALTATKANYGLVVAPMVRRRQTINT